MNVARYIQHIEVEVCGNPAIVERENFNPVTISEIIEANMKIQGLYVPVRIVAKASAWGIGGPRARMVIGNNRTPVDNDIQAHEEVRSIIRKAAINATSPYMNSPFYPSSAEIAAVYYAIEQGLGS